jgi:signal peptidase II
MRFRQRLALVASLVCLCIAIDQATKALASAYLPGEPVVYHLGGVLQLWHAENAGTFLSYGVGLAEATRMWVFAFVIGLATVGVLALILIKRDVKRLYVACGSLIAGGSLSNLIDRMLNEGRVVDFLYIRVAPLDRLIFNVADVAITAGMALLVVAALRSLSVTLRSASQDH